jgi:hypothetical protein
MGGEAVTRGEIEGTRPPHFSMPKEAGYYWVKTAHARRITDGSPVVFSRWTWENPETFWTIIEVRAEDVNDANPYSPQLGTDMGFWWNEETVVEIRKIEEPS